MRIPISIRLDPAVLEQLERESQEQHRTRSQTAEILLAQALKRLEQVRQAAITKAQRKEATV